MLLKRIFPAILFLLVFSHKPAIAQSYIADTIRLVMPAADSLLLPFTLQAKDYRENGPRFISVYGKKKYLFLPVDQVVVADKPVSSAFSFEKEDASQTEYLLGIHEFYISQYLSTFNRLYKFNAILNLTEINNADTLNLGTFYYEQSLKKKKSLTDSAAFNQVLNLYSSEIKKNLNAVCNDTSGNSDLTSCHFRQNSAAIEKNLYTTADVFFGRDFWGLDLELYFSDPEPSGQFSRNSRMLRYLEYVNRESVAVSGRVSLFNYRVSDKVLFQNKSAFLLGFNKWHDIDEQERTLYEIFLLQLTATQRICLNRLDKQGIILGAGLFEEFSYVYSNKPMLNYGLMLHLGYKF